MQGDIIWVNIAQADLHIIMLQGYNINWGAIA